MQPTLGEKPMNDTEIGALRQKLASRVRSDDYRQRRKDMDARALEYKIAPDVTVEPVTANGVPAEWTSTPNDARHCRQARSGSVPPATAFLATTWRRPVAKSSSATSTRNVAGSSAS